eukprot:CFRG0969T1
MQGFKLDVPDWDGGSGDAISSVGSLSAGGSAWANPVKKPMSATAKKRANRKKNRREAGAAREAAGIPKRTHESKVQSDHGKPKRDNVKKVKKKLEKSMGEKPIKALKLKKKAAKNSSRQTHINEPDSVQDGVISRVVPVVLKSKKKYNPLKRLSDASAADIDTDASAADIDTDATKPINKNEQTNTSGQDKSKKRVSETVTVDAKAAKRRKLQSILQATITATSTNKSTNDLQAGPKKRKSKMDIARNKLDGAKFRWLNEQLYTMHSDKAVKMMKEAPDLYELYHIGFRSQVMTWPTNPVDVMIDYVRTLPGNYVVGDFGCGDAALASAVGKTHIVHSFDLVAANSTVTACDIAHVPLKDRSLDVAVYSLALMGTNHRDFLREAHRVLKNKGILKIAEVTSRIPNIDDFIQVLSEEFGFDLVDKDVRNSHFLMFTFTKARRINTDEQNLSTEVLRPCIYKRR